MKNNKIREKLKNCERNEKLQTDQNIANKTKFGKKVEKKLKILK